MKLKKFLPRGRGARQPEFAVALRQARDEPLSARTERRAVPAPGAEAAPRVPSTAADVTSLAQLPGWRGLVSGVVGEAQRASCVVLDLEYRSVLVLGTQAFFASGAHGALLQALSAKSWSISAERTGSAEVIAQVRQLAEQRKRQASVAATDDSQTANAQLYQDLNRGAFELKASDIHISLGLRSGRSAVRLRIDGKLQLWKTFDTKVLNDALAAGYHSLSIKGTNSSATWTTERPINTITRFIAGSTPLHGRLSTQPTTGGCGVVIRVIDASPEALLGATLDRSGFTRQQIDEDLLPGLMRTHGFILVGGSTGDGKTTTLQRMLMNLPDRDEKSLWGVEDPNELEVPGMEHVSIQRNPDDTVEHVRLKYHAAFLQMMRLDPDIIFQGEIRDRISGEFASEAVMTGHLLLVSMHGNSAIGQIMRLLGDRIDMSPELLANRGNFVLSMAQKLVPLLCEHCKQPAAEVMAPEDLGLLRSRFQLDMARLFCARDGGCDHCRPEPGMSANGQSGRTVAAEIISHPTPQFLDAILRRDERGAEIAWRETRRAPFSSPDMRGKTAYEHALYLASTGRVSPLALQPVFGHHFSQVEVFGMQKLKDAA